MRRFFASVLACSIAVAAAPLSPASSQGTRDESANAEDPGERYFQNLFAGRFDEALAAANAFPRDLPTVEARALVMAMRAGALLGLKRDSEAKRLVAEIERLKVHDPYPYALLFNAAMIAERYDIAADSFDILLARFPDAAREQEPDFVSYLLRNAPKDQERRNDDRRIALARIGFGGDTPTADWHAFNAIGLLLERGDVTAAQDLLRYVDEVDAIETMLINKRYSALWPNLEQRVGPHLAKVKETSVASAQRAYAENPDDSRSLAILVEAYRNAGRLDDAIALRSKLPGTPKEMSDADEQLGWAVNNVALAMFEASRLDEGDQLFALLNEAPMAEGRGRWRVNMIINRLEALAAAGRFDRALALVDATEKSAREDGNAYAQQLVRRLKFCILASLGRTVDAAKVLPAMLDHADDAIRATIEGLLCAGEVDKAEQIAVRMLTDPKLDKARKSQWEEDLVAALQSIPLSNSDPSVWAKSWTSLRERPAIAAAYTRLGRDMPTQFLPERRSAPIAN